MKRLFLSVETDLTLSGLGFDSLEFCTSLATLMNMRTRLHFLYALIVKHLKNSSV